MINIFKDFNLGDIVLPGSDLPTRNKNFVGRELYLEDIESAFFKEDKKIILMPARFTAWKGHEFLIDALTLVKNDFFCV